MSLSSPRIKDREKLNKDLSKYLKNGGKIRVIESSSIRYEKEQIVKRGLFHTVHFPFISRETGLTVAKLRSIKRQMWMISDAELAILYNFFQDRDLSNMSAKS